MPPSSSNRYQSELDRMQDRIAELESQIDERRSLLAYLDSLAGKSPAPARPAEPRAPRKPGKAPRIGQAVLAALEGGKKLSTPDLIAAARAMGVTSRTESIHSAISTLRKKGTIKAHKHKGRGNAYTLA